MKFRATLVAEYEVMKTTLRENYGTTDPRQAAAVDQQAITDDPFVLIEMGDTKPTITVEVVDENEQTAEEFIVMVASMDQGHAGTLADEWLVKKGIFKESRRNT